MKEKAKILRMAVVTALMMVAMTVTALASSTPANPIDELGTTLTTQMGNVLPHLTSAAAAVIGAIAPVALTIAGMIAVFTLTVGIFRRMTGR